MSPIVGTAVFLALVIVPLMVAEVRARRAKRTASLYAQFISFDDQLAAVGVPPLGKWWRAGLKRWFERYEDGDAYELTACVGRGAAKSTCLYKLAAFFALFGRFDVPPAETHYAIVLSRLTEEARKGIRIIDAWLGLLGIPHTTTQDVIVLTDTRRGIRVVAASVAGVTGWRAFFVGRDERSKWGESLNDNEDADEVDASANAMTVTHANAVTVDAGSAWGQFGSFYENVMAGDTDRAVVLGPSPTWIASDGRVTEAACRRLARGDDRIFAREYGCEFQGSATAALDVATLRACVVNPIGFEASGAAVIVMDPSGGSGNASAWAAFQWGTINNRPALRMFDAHAIVDARKVGMSFDDMADAIAATARDVGAVHVHSDQHASWSWESAFAKRGFAFTSHPWTSTGTDKRDAILRLRELIRERHLAVDAGTEADELVAEAALYQEQISPSGHTRYTPAKGNDDRVLTLLLAARLDIESDLGGSPLDAGRDDYVHADQIGEPIEVDIDRMEIG